MKRAQAEELAFAAIEALAVAGALPPDLNLTVGRDFVAVESDDRINTEAEVFYIRHIVDAFERVELEPAKPAAPARPTLTPDEFSKVMRALRRTFVWYEREPLEAKLTEALG